MGVWEGVAWGVGWAVNEHQGFLGKGKKGSGDRNSPAHRRAQSALTTTLRDACYSYWSHFIQKETEALRG